VEHTAVGCFQQDTEVERHIVQTDQVLASFQSFEVVRVVVEMGTGYNFHSLPPAQMTSEMGWLQKLAFGIACAVVEGEPHMSTVVVHMFLVGRCLYKSSLHQLHRAHSLRWKDTLWMMAVEGEGYIHQYYVGCMYSIAVPRAYDRSIVQR
jgi:hypothetical protein